MDIIYPFKIGGAVELRSFEKGYRGAWFRCKVSDMCIRYGHMEYQLEYMDYPEEKRSWNRLYKIPPEYRKKAGQKAGRKACQKAGQKRELMLRPPFPRWCLDNHTPEHGQKMDVVAIVSSPWKVGDLIEWRYNSCYWTGKIIELLGDDKAKIACLEIPLGEGGIYEVDVGDLRPALDWSLEKGWSAPLSKENGECWYTVRLFRENPDTGSSSSDEDIEQSYDGIKEECLDGSFDTAKQEQRKCLSGSSVTTEKAKGPGVKHPASTNGRHCMKSQPHSEEEPQKFTNEDPDTSLVAIRSKAADESDECCTNSQADSPTSPMANSGGHSPQLMRRAQDLVQSIGSLTGSKRLKTSTDDASVESPAPDTVGEALMDVGRVASKIRRAQDLLQSIDDAPPSNRGPARSWRFCR